MFFTAFPLFMPKSESLLSLFDPLLFFINSDRSDLLQSLFTKEQLWANRSCRSLQKSYSFMSKSLFRSQKMSNLLEEPKSKCPTLHFGLCTGILRKFELYGAPYRLQKTFFGRKYNFIWKSSFWIIGKLTQKFICWNSRTI